MKSTTTSTLRYFSVAIAFIILLTTVVWLGKNQESEPPNDNTTAVQLRDVLVLTQTQVSSFDPLDAFHEGNIQVVKQIYETLTDIDENGACVPLLAHRWETNDNRIWRFHLKPDVYFTSSLAFASKADRRLTAKDVVYSFERLLAPESKSLGVAYFKAIAGFQSYRSGKTPRLLGVRALSASIVEFELVKPNAGFHCVLSIPYASIVSQTIVTHFDEDFKLNPIGTGPFTLSIYTPDQKIILERKHNFRINPDEPSKTTVEQVEILLTRDNNAAFAKFASGASDFLVLDRASLARLNHDSNLAPVNILSKPTAKLQLYLFNLKTLESSDVRRRIAAAIDRDSLQAILDDTGTIAESIFPPSIFPNLSGLHFSLTNNDAPKAEPTQIGGILRLVCFNDQVSRAIASRVANDLQKLGYEVKIEAATFPVLVERLTQGEYDLIQIYWGPLYAEPAHFLTPFLSSQFPPEGNNFNQYSNSRFDASVSAAEAAGTPQARTELFLKAQDILLDDMPLIPLYFENLLRASNGKFLLPMHPLLYRRYSEARPR
ncbi:MAG: ABC transporter substrate-binding protein [Candidatus Thiodiazotropha taylori]